MSDKETLGALLFAMVMFAVGFSLGGVMMIADYEDDIAILEARIETMKELGIPEPTP